MIVYALEFALLHIVFFLVYKLMLSGETHLTFRRYFLLASTVLALVIPLVSLPETQQIPNIELEALFLPTFSTAEIPTSASINIPWIYGLLIIPGSYWIFRIATGVYHIFSLVRRSDEKVMCGVPVRLLSELSQSFSFFRWIFVNCTDEQHAEPIIRHELGHVKHLHSLDVLFINFMLIVFWWVPTIWLMLKELKVIHEYQADKFAMNYTGREEYVKTLVYSTLTYHGLNLASSFSDAPIVKRLKFMKMMKKKVNPFKSGSILVIVAITAAMFACDDEIDAEINKIADQSTEQLVVDNPEVKLELEKLQAVNPDAEYAVIQTKYENKESLDMMKEIDPKQIEHVFINKTKYDKSITIILRKDSKLFEKTVENATKSKGEDDVFTVVEQTPQFPGGMEAFYEYLSTNLKYPEEAIKNQAEGKVYVEFVVEKNGDLSNVRAVKGVGYGCDEEAVRVVKNAPAFEPGEQRGRKVRVKMVLPIMFKQPVKNG